MSQPRLPDGFAVQVDRRVRVLGEGAALLGGSPTRLLRLAPAAQTMLNGGRLEVHDALSAQVARTLLDATVAHPRPASGPSHRDVTVVIPVRDNESGVHAVGVGVAWHACRGGGRRFGDPDPAIGFRRHALRRSGAAPSPQQGTGGRAQHRPGRLRHRLRRVPGLRCGSAARLAGGAARPLLRSRSGFGRAAHRELGAADSLVARYEAVRSSLDLGQREAPVVPYGTVSYVPSAAIICRRSVLREVGGFDETMKSGEDVDLCWRLIEAGARLRYEPIAMVAHEHRTQLREWFVRKAFYGESAAPLSLRHPGKTAPLVISGWTLVVWILLHDGLRRRLPRIHGGGHDHRPSDRQLARHGRHRTQGGRGRRRARPLVGGPAARRRDLSALLADRAGARDAVSAVPTTSCWWRRSSTVSWIG